MAVKVFLLGRPGSGKSTAAQRIIRLAQRKNWATTYIGDYEILHRWFESEKRNPYIKHKYFDPTDYEGFNVSDFSVLRIALEEVKRRIQKHVQSRTKLILIEFARDDYSEVLRTFDNEILHDAYFLFLHSDIDVCIQRILTRTAHHITIHDHYVSKEIIESYYARDNRSYILSQFAKDYNLDYERVTVIDNMSSWDDFMQQIKKFTNDLFERELSTFCRTGPLLEASPGQKKACRITEPLSGECPSFAQYANKLHERKHDTYVLEQITTIL